MINAQEYITTKLKKTLEKMIIFSNPSLNNLIAIIIGVFYTYDSFRNTIKNSSTEKCII